MEKITRIKELLKTLSENIKGDILKNLDETVPHGEIRELLLAMEPGSYVEIAHGPEEYGKDLVVIR